MDFRGFAACFLILLAVPVPPGAEALTFQNTCGHPISVSTFNVSNKSSVDITPNESKSVVEPDGSSITFWGCKSGDADCVNSDNPIATMGLVENSIDSNSYSLSAEIGFNLGVTIMPLAGSANYCPTISCTANLNDCPDQLKITNSNNDTVIACKAPSCVESEEMCSSFSSLVTTNDSRCKSGGSAYDPSEISPTCPSSIELVAIFSC